MPADFYIDVPRRLVFSKGIGVLSRADCTDHMDRLQAHPDFRPEFGQLLDFRGVTEVTVTSAEIILLAERPIFSPDSRRAFVVTSDLHFGLVRMFMSYREIAGEQGIKIFRDMSAALEYLSLVDEADPKKFTKLQQSTW
jgi:hypothetical protein